MQTLKKYICYLLIAVLGLLIVPKELLHEFAATDHIDTEDISCQCDMQHLDAEHTHCDVLQLAAPELFQFTKNEVSFTTIVVAHVQHGNVIEQQTEQPLCIYLRGPPAMLFS